MNQDQPVSIDALNAVQACDAGFEFEYIGPDGKGSGRFFTVIGEQSEQVQEWIRKRLNKLRRDEDMARRRGKEIQRLVETDQQFGIESAAIRITGWRGISEECTFDNAVRLCTINPLIRAQVLDASADLGNFMKG